METKTTPVTVEAKDILNLGFAFYCDENDNMSFSIDLNEHSGLSLILLRSVLLCYGDYKVVGESEFIDEEEQDQYGNSMTYEIYQTNLPKSEFLDVVGDNVYIEDLSDIEDYLISVDI